MVLNQDFREFIKLLNERNVKYLVIGGYAVPFIDVDSLIITKKAAGRMQDLADVEQLENGRE